jgi:hypothetical protein
VDGRSPTPATGQLEVRQDPAGDEQCEQTKDRKREMSTASAPARGIDQRREAGTR